VEDITDCKNKSPDFLIFLTPDSMKSLKLLFSLLLLASMPFFAQANPITPDNEPIVKTEVEGMVLTLNLANLGGKDAKIEITSLFDRVEFHKYWVKDHNGYGQRLNFKKVPQGRYLLKVRHDGEIYQKVLKVEEDRVLVSH